MNYTDYYDEGEEENGMEFDIYSGKPSDEEVIEFAKVLGMHPIRDKALLWFAEQSSDFIIRVP